LVDTVHVDDGQGILEGVKRSRRIVFRAQQTEFLGSHREKHDRSARRGTKARVGFGDFEQTSRSARIIEGAVINLVAFQRRVAAKMIPVGRVDHVLVADLRIRSLEPRNHILRLDFANGIRQFERRFRGNRHRPEISTDRCTLQLVEIMARRLE
jgi:hypothetical protein